MPTWDQFAWAAFLYGSLAGGDYETLMGKREFIEPLRKSPQVLSPSDICDNLILFLNQWKTHVHKSCAGRLRSAIVKMQPEMAVLSGENIVTVNFGMQTAVEGRPTTIGTLVEKCFECVKGVNGLGPTATAKILHILCPNLFVMWDGRILRCYSKVDNRIDGSGTGYAVFLEYAQRVAKQVTASFATYRPTPPPEDGDTPEAYLSRHLGSGASTTMAKFIDEYHWVTITKDTIVPPKWWPIYE
jgi:hypothetical protein